MSITSLPLPFDTRRAAHARVRPAKERRYRRILDFGRTRGPCGLTADELVAAWNCSANSVAPRICELKKSGRLVETKRTRLTRSGSPARVYVLPEFAERHRDNG
jgi:hypothetical protein